MNQLHMHVCILIFMKHVCFSDYYRDVMLYVLITAEPEKQETPIIKEGARL